MSHSTFLAFSCVHCPIHDADGLRWLVDQVGELQPQYLINLGDTFDAESLSSFAKVNEFRLSEEYDAAGQFLAELHDVSPKSHKIWLMGNHEQRMLRPDSRHVADLIDYRKRIDEAKRWKHIEYRYHPEGTFCLGKMTFYHGFVCGRNSVKGESIKLGVPNGCTVSGHTHRPNPIHRISLGVCPLPFFMLNPGCFIKPDVEYMLTKDSSLWGQGVITGHVDRDGRNSSKQNWEANLVLRKMYWDDTATHA